MKRNIKKFMAKVTLMCCLSLSLGCGGLQEDTLLNLQGSITVSENTQLPSGNVHVGLLWLFRKVDTGFDMAMLDSVVGSEFPMEFNLDVFSFPPDSALMNSQDMQPYFEMIKEYDIMGIMNGVGYSDLFPKDVKLGAALILVWEDTNGTGKFEFEFGPNSDNETLAQALAHGGPDRIIGGAPNFSVAYVSDPGLSDKAYEIQNAFKEQYTENIFDFAHGEKMNVGYTLLQVTGTIVYFPWYAQQFRPVPNSTRVDLVISDDLSLAIPHCCGD
jgi:hypothetical protein